MSNAESLPNQPLNVAGQREPVLITAVEWQLLKPVLDWLRGPFGQDPVTLATPAGPGFYVDQRFAEAFALRLRLFHSLHSPAEAMTKKAFEFAFEFAAKAAGHEASIDPSSTTEASDIVVDGAGFSLKTEAARGIAKGHITISKLMESLWTKHCKTIGDFLAGIQQHVVPRVEHSQRFFVLRAFGRLATAGVIEYELVEVPRDLLLAMQDVKAEHFGPITRAKGTRVQVQYDGAPAYTLVFDGSDQKVTVRQLPTSRCVTHLRWTLRAPPATSP